MPTPWIWLDAGQPNQPNQYAQFRREFAIEALPDSAELLISADSNFVAWLNGRFLHTGQFTDFPDARTHSRMDLKPYLRPGRNVLALLVHYIGIDHFSYLPGDAGVWFEIEADGKTLIQSDPRTLGRQADDYQQEWIARISPQRGFTFHFDGRNEDPWREVDFQAGPDWRPAVVGQSSSRPSPRPVAMLNLRPLRPGAIVAQGLLKRDPSPDQTIGQRMQHDYLSARRSWELFVDQPPVPSPARFPVKLGPDRLEGADGAYLVLDLGEQECGFIELELSAAGGCTLDIAVGEHLDDLRTRASIGGRNFASRYVARPGRQRFVHYLDRYAGRYLQLHLTAMTGPVELHHAGLIPAEFPLEFAGAFDSSDSLHNRIWNLSRRTLHLCMHEHYEDCPWREQALYANDSRNQMLCGYYAFGNYDFARTSLDLLGRTTGPDGYQELCAPMKFDFTIPSFTLTWLLAMNDYLMYSGDREFIARQTPRMKQMIQAYLSTLTEGLFPCPQGKRYWQFYDWAPGLDGTVHDDCRQMNFLEKTRFDAPLNFFLILALRAVAHMAGHVDQADFAAGCLDAAESLRSTAGRAFWDDSRQAYLTYRGACAPVHVAELTQSLALLAGLDDASPRTVQQKLMDQNSGWVPATLSQSFYKYEALLLDASNGPFVLNDIAQTWSAMIYAGATTFWETRQGGWDFHHAGSLCHGWSAIPAYFYGAYGLGLKPLSPGQTKLHYKPCLPFFDLKGALPTPAGPVHLHRQGERVQIDAPAGVEVLPDPSISAILSLSPNK